jgi:hypothetical protein
MQSNSRRELEISSFLGQKSQSLELFVLDVYVKNYKNYGKLV